MNTIEIKERIIAAGKKAVDQLIKVAEENILADGEDNDIAADRLKNAAATKKLAIFDAFEILSRIEDEKRMIEDAMKNPGETEGYKTKLGFAEKNSK